ncbi:hypothetical protein PENTCL1PPCAC_13007, partial [Pristionchus entomophagus]
FGMILKYLDGFILHNTLILFHVSLAKLIRHLSLPSFPSFWPLRGGSLHSFYSPLNNMAFTDMTKQEKVCTEDGVLCGIAEVEERRSFGRSSWEQMIVLRPNGCLLIY